MTKNVVRFLGELLFTNEWLCGIFMDKEIGTKLEKFLKLSKITSRKSRKVTHKTTLIDTPASNPSGFFNLVTTNDTSLLLVIARHIGHLNDALLLRTYTNDLLCSWTTHLQHMQWPHLKTAHWNINSEGLEQTNKQTKKHYSYVTLGI